ncbi:hypothetical protein ASE01_10645 [Nocardioides sp. Root190]|uniref:hypothetical protein n=1 Tax=Nocardioides sp. Root190 TaxID=1736488 RepID=UPI0007009E82|nr:hypothetical protein [Nocardioides sp. Root190]KRB77194.1 hypothetical protein ASE01_10645 [Nocardioides sp. Root190]
MTDSYAPPTARNRRRKPLLLGLAALLLISAGATAGVWWTQRGPDIPDEWDARVQPYVDIVEKQRGLEFEHPVHVDFLSEAAFQREVTSEESELAEDELEEMEDAAGMMRAIGLLGGDVDLLDVMNDLMAGGVIGLYDPEDKRIRMRGTELTPDVRSTLVHELTHALQDQHFDLEEKREQFEEEDDTSASAVWGALLEGDADRVESAWAESLPAAERKAVEKAQKTASDKATKDLAGVPPFLTTLLGSRYVFGTGLIGLTLELDGKDAVNGLFTSPPTSEEGLVDPWIAAADRQAAWPVDQPEVPEGAKKLESGTFGAPSLLFMLAERISPKTALVATDGWGGDHYVAYEQDDRSCVRLDWVGDSRRDVTELTAALRTWVARGPAGSASVTSEGRGLRLQSCEPDAKARPGTGGSEAALQLVALRAQFAQELLRTETPKEFTRCYADNVVGELSIDQLTSEKTSPALQRRLEQLAQRCV